MADTFIKRPVLYKGTKAQIESATMGENDFAVATDVEFYTKEEVDSLIAGAGGGLESVSHDASLTGAGTADSPLGIASTVTAQINSKADQTVVDVLSGEVSDLMGDFAQLPSTYVTQQALANEISAINNDTTLIKETLNGKVNIAQGVENAGKILKVDNDGNVVVGEGGGASLPILMSMWSDRVINDMSWLRADTFSWHSGDVYVAAYQHLANELLAQTNAPIYAWVHEFSGDVYTTTTLTPSAGDKTIEGYDITSVGTGYIEVKAANCYRDSSKDSTTSLSKTETIGDITITYYQADDGHKICLPDQESNLVALYEATGVAWYYVLDTENKRFKLPRTKWGFTGLRDSVGGFVEAGLPNITGSVSIPATFGSSSSSGAFKTTNSGATGSPNNVSKSGDLNISIDASRSSSIYGASDTVQPPATQMYLYFYVGNFEQSALGQTAGFTSEILNATVADIDLSNITSAAKTKIAGMGMPDYTAGISISSAQTYTPTTNVLVVATAEQSGKIDITVKYPDGNSNIVYGTYLNDVIAVPFFFNAGVELTLTSGTFKIYPLTKGL